MDTAKIKGLSVYYGVQVIIMAFFSAISVGITIASFWVLDETPLFSIDIELFLNEFAFPFFFASFALLIVNRIFQWILDFQ